VKLGAIDKRRQDETRHLDKAKRSKAPIQGRHLGKIRWGDARQQGEAKHLLQGWLREAGTNARQGEAR
jgi:hypothetical protein